MQLRPNLKLGSFVVGAVTVGALAVFAACGSSNNGSNGGTQTDGGGGGDAASTNHSDSGGATGDGGAGPIARFNLSGSAMPQFLDVPFPTDAYRADGGTIIDPIPGLDTMVPRSTSYITHAIGTMNGFSRIALSMFAIDATPAVDDASAAVAAIIDPTTLPVAETDCQKATSSVYVVDLASGATTPILPCRAAFHDDGPSSAVTPVVVVGPPRGYLLDEAHQYAAVLTSRVKDTSGHAITASADMLAVAAGQVSADGAVGTLYATAYTTAAAILKTNLATDGATIVAIAPYTTLKKTQELFTMRAALETQAAPTLSWDADAMAPMGATKFAKVAPEEDGGAGTVIPAGFTDSTDHYFGVATQKLPNGTDDPDSALNVIAHDQIAAIGSAVYSATSYLQVSPQGYEDPANGTFAYDSSGNPVIQAPVKIWITFAIPTAPMPANGYPVVILQHGISSSRTEMMPLANVMATQGWAVALIDSVTFGARAPEPSMTVDKVNNFSFTGAGAPTYDGPDGFADTENGSTDFFGNLLDVLAISDQFRQSGYDVAQMVQLLRSGTLDLSPLATGATTPKLDPSSIAFVGNSLGGMIGTMGAAIEPRVKAWYLNVAGGSLMTELAAHSPDIGKEVGAAAGLNFGIVNSTFNWSNPLIALLAESVDPGDPISYASYLSTNPQTIAGVPAAPRNVLHTETIWDEIVTNEAQEALARAAGWSMATPNVGSNADISDPADAGGNLRATPFTFVSPDDAGAIHDTPKAGATAVLVQCSPCQHGENLLSSEAADLYGVPYAPPFQTLNKPFTFTEDYRAMQTMGVTFIGDAFAGNVPRVMGYDVPVRNR